MKFEIDPNELTTDQRAHVAAFITGWPRDPAEEAVRTILSQGSSGQWGVTEEQRLDAEQANDMGTSGELREISGVDEARELGAVAADNLNAIFGTPSKVVDSIPSVPLDKEGLPWDSRIHASTKTFIADGSWKLRRGVDPAEVEKVKAQLKELMAVPTVAPSAMGSNVLNTPTYPVDDVVHNSGHVDYDPASRIPAPVALATVTIGSASHIPVPPAPKSHYLIDQDPTVATNQQPVTLTDLIARMSSAIVAGKMTQATVTEMCAKHGVSEFMLLSNRPDLLPLIDADMKAMGV